MRVMFRADASTEIGAGHVMRCIALADALKRAGNDCRFICREHRGNLIEALRMRRFVVYAIPDIGLKSTPLLTSSDEDAKVDVSHDLEPSVQMDDYEACREYFLHWAPDWVVVDHYDLGIYWEQRIRTLCKNILVIDDLPSRPHDCSLLLDQTLGRERVDYLPFVATKTPILSGAPYALLRSEFASNRYTHLASRQFDSVRTIMVSMGGSDFSNITAKVLLSLTNCVLPRNCNVTVIVGPQSLHLRSIQALAQDFPRNLRVLSDVDDMAKMMARSDVAIGAAGSSAWERCCMGLPSVTIPIVTNQSQIAVALDNIGASRSLMKEDLQTAKAASVISSLIVNESVRRDISARAARCVDGYGAARVAAEIRRLNG